MVADRITVAVTTGTDIGIVFRPPCAGRNPGEFAFSVRFQVVGEVVNTLATDLD